MQEFSEIYKLMSNLKGSCHSKDLNFIKSNQSNMKSRDDGLISENNINQIILLNLNLNSYTDNDIIDRYYNIFEFTFKFSFSSILFLNSKYCEQIDLKTKKKNSKIMIDSKCFKIKINENGNLKISHDKRDHIISKDIPKIISDFVFLHSKEKMFYFKNEEINTSIRIFSIYETKLFINKNSLKVSKFSTEDINSYYLLTFNLEKKTLTLNFNNKEEKMISQTEINDLFVSTNNVTDVNISSLKFNVYEMDVNIQTNNKMELDGIFCFYEGHDNLDFFTKYEDSNFQKSRFCKIEKDQFLILQCKKNENFNEFKFHELLKQIERNVIDIQNNSIILDKKFILIITVASVGDKKLTPNQINSLKEFENKYQCEIIFLFLKKELLNINIYKQIKSQNFFERLFIKKIKNNETKTEKIISEIKTGITDVDKRITDVDKRITDVDKRLNNITNLLLLIIIIFILFPIGISFLYMHVQKSI